MESKSDLAPTFGIDQLLGYLRRSDRLNTLYTGPDWIDIGWDKFTLAAEAEFNEFLTELTGDWKWYSTKPKIDRNKALFELVDWFLFSASAVNCYLMPTGLDGIEEKIQAAPELVRPEGYGSGPTGLGDLNHTKSLMVSAAGHVCAGTMIKLLGMTVETALAYLGATEDDFDRAYNVKYQLCLKRVEGGILTGGSYRKDDEVYPEILK